jgi:hypothetical protein
MTKQKKGKIEKFIEKDFGLGGAPNYDREQIDAVLKLFIIFYGENLASKERETILKFLNKMERADAHYKERIDMLEDEAEELKGIGY